MQYQTCRPQQALLIHTKQPLRKPQSKPFATINPSSRPADIQLRTPDTTASGSADMDQNRKPEGVSTVEYDFAKIPQPFLEPKLWENVKAVDRLRCQQPLSASTEDFESREKEELERRQRRRDAEFGGMAL
ncbi:hypothetical protein FE257_002375 [Aspergillus nanangensis]|uniref:Uncharacterized protein n=1 Tax=Aspergillus nanangensis TaxID=2582783 RepID=A0AAD4GP22_ASPNN|nr:hypothetical protein FE257_002375 [Aspergillus nanangensis]